MIAWKIVQVSLGMFYEVFWPLVLGFTLSAVIQSVVSHRSIAQVLGQDSPKSLSLAALFGCASSSCSYAAVALAKSLFKKGASFRNAMVFELSSTNLVVELGIILWVLMGPVFTLSEFVGGVLMILLITLLFRLSLSQNLINEARHNLSKGLIGKMEGHAEMDMRGEAFTSISHYFVMDWVSIWIDLLLGFLIAGTLEVVVPSSFWQSFFLTSHPALAMIEGPLLGPLVAVISFVCSVGNIPLAAVLWNGGISFGGVVSFIFADLIVLPILDIYRKYYGLKVMGYILITFYLTMALSGLLVEILFGALGIIPTQRSLIALNPVFGFNYTAVLNGVFLILSLFFIVQFLKTNGLEMLKHM